MYDKGDERSGNNSLWQLMTHPIGILILGSILVAFLVLRQRDLEEKESGTYQEKVETPQKDKVESPKKKENQDTEGKKNTPTGKEKVSTKKQDIPNQKEVTPTEKKETASTPQEEPKSKETRTSGTDVSEHNSAPVETKDKYAIEVGYSMGKVRPIKHKRNKNKR